MIARGGRGFVGLASAAALVALPFEWKAAAGFGGLALFLAIMFRDPKRTIGDGIVAPADGTVREVDSSRGLVSIYLALRNVHVTRAPLDAVVRKTETINGRHVPAFASRSQHNQRLEITLETGIGSVKAVEMVGAVARRIVPYVREGQTLQKGDKLSLIRFGSRVDLFLPADRVRITAATGQRLKAGTTRIAEALDGRP